MDGWLSFYTDVLLGLGVSERRQPRALRRGTLDRVAEGPPDQPMVDPDLKTAGRGAPRVLTLVVPERSYRLVGRQMG